MKISRSFPPNFADIVKVLPAVRKKPTIVFTYGDTIYAPGRNVVVDDHLVAHEEVHQRQQSEMGVEKWWKKYLEDSSFRLEQELEAYRTQFIYLENHHNRATRKKLLPHMAGALCGEMYGKVVDKQKAKDLIMGRATL